MDVATPPASWPLSGAGRAAAGELADQLDLSRVEMVASSSERKAIETALPFALRTRLDTTILKGLHEVSRPWITDVGLFVSTCQEWLGGKEQPGWESIGEVRQRMTEAIDQLLERSRSDVVVVGHGTSLATWLAASTDDDPVRWWTEAGMPHATTLVTQDGSQFAIA